MLENLKSWERISMHEQQTWLPMEQEGPFI